MSDIASIMDAEGRIWSVTKVLPTVHGFDVYKGRMPGTRGFAQVILTSDLVNYLKSIERLRDVSLPLSNQTRRTLRGKVGIKKFDWNKWWMSRKKDLLSLKTAKFCEKHHVSLNAVTQRRKHLKRNGNFKTFGK